MDLLNTSLFSVPWDLRAIWRILTVVAQTYLMGLFGMAVFAILRTARTLWFHRQVRQDSSQEAATTYERLASRMHSLRQFLVFGLLVFGVVLANEVFASLRAVQLSYTSLSEYHLREALEVPTAFAFFSLSVFVCLHALQWCADATIQSRLRRK